MELHSDPLGTFAGAILQRTDIKVARGDRFFMYSDGLIEATPGSGRREGLERLVEACITYSRFADRGSLWQKIARQVAGGQANDDLLLLAAEVSR